MFLIQRAFHSHFQSKDYINNTKYFSLLGIILAFYFICYCLYCGNWRSEYHSSQMFLPKNLLLKVWHQSSLCGSSQEEERNGHYCLFGNRKAHGFKHRGGTLIFLSTISRNNLLRIPDSEIISGSSQRCLLFLIFLTVAVFS